MAEDTTAASESDEGGKKKKGKKKGNHVYLISYPKIVFLYPTFFFALFAGIYTSVKGDVQTSGTEMVTLIFMLLFAANLIVLAFDFPRTTSITWFAAGAVIVMGLILLFTNKPELLPVAKSLFDKLNPFANATFYFMYATFLGLMYIAVYIVVQFDYWEVRNNELLHHHGVLSDLERFSAPNLRIDKEINDLFEYMLLRSGRLILHPSQEKRAIVLENVFFINRKEQEITKMLGALNVQVHNADS